MLKILGIFVLAAGVALSGGALAQAALFSGFDSSAEGWTVYGASGLTHAISGGNPGGFIHAYDSASTWWMFQAPAAWNGDWSAYLGGTFSYDILCMENNANQSNWDIEIYNGTNVARWVANKYPTEDVWTHFSVVLNDANFDTPVGTLADILANVTMVRIRGDLVNGTGASVDKTGLDNVSVAPIPLPGALWLLGSGLAGLGLLRRRS